MADPRLEADENIFEGGKNRLTVTGDSNEVNFADIENEVNFADIENEVHFADHNADPKNAEKHDL